MGKCNTGLLSWNKSIQTFFSSFGNYVAGVVLLLLPPLLFFLLPPLLFFFF
jgi:hypothetical protein